MSLHTCLTRARGLVADGWHPMFTFDASGRVCMPTDEAAATFDLGGALEVSSSSGAERADAWELLESVLRPVTAALDRACRSWGDGSTTAEIAALAKASLGEPPGLLTWLHGPKRKLAHVLMLLDVAISKAKTREAA